MVTRVSEQLNSQNNSAAIQSMWSTGSYNAKVYNLVGDGTTNDYTKLYNLINTTINGAEATIIFPKGTYKISSNITIPSNISLYFVKGAMLSPDSGVTVTINGPVQADLWKIFTGSGTIAGSMKVDAVYPQWWGAVGDGVTDDTAAIQAAFNVTGSEYVFFPKPSGTYKTTSDITLNGKTPLYFGGYISGTWKPPVEKSLSTVEGFDSTKYRHKIAISYTVGDNTNRYWAIIGDVVVPAGTVYTAPHVVDHVGLRGQALTSAPQSRIWGGAFLVNADASAKPTDNDKTKLPSMFGAELDINNNTGLDMNDLTWQEMAGLIIATGGANRVFAGSIISKLATSAGFHIGHFFKDSSIVFAGLMFDDVAPSYGIYATPSYTGGPMISIPDGKTAVEFRGTDPRTMLLRSLGNALYLNIGTAGFNIVNNADDTVLASMSNAGVWAPKTSKPTVSVHTKVVLANGATSINASQGNFFATVNTGATTISSITSGTDGQEIRILFTDANTTITHTAGNGIKLSGGVNFVSTVNDMMTLIFDGLNWLECSRSING